MWFQSHVGSHIFRSFLKKKQGSYRTVISFLFGSKGSVDHVIHWIQFIFKMNLLDFPKEKVENDAEQGRLESSINFYQSIGENDVCLFSLFKVLVILPIFDWIK